MPVLLSMGYLITLYDFAHAAEYICGVSKFLVLSFLKFSFQILCWVFFLLLLLFLYIIFTKLSWDKFSMGLYSTLKIGGFFCGLGFSCSLLSTESSKPGFTFAALMGSFLDLTVRIWEILCMAMRRTGRGSQ